MAKTISRPGKPSNRYERCDQILAWLTHEYPCGRKVKIVWRDEILIRDEETGELREHWGTADRVGRSMVIEMSKKKCRTWTESVDILIHEYVHCMLWGLASVEAHPKLEEHPPAFDAQCSAITGRFHRNGGSEESYGFPFNRRRVQPRNR